jgi:hypothetical protein
MYEDHKCIRKYCLQSEETSPLGKPTHRLEDKIEMDS